MASVTLPFILLLAVGVGCSIAYWLLRGKSQGLLDQLAANHARDIADREERLQQQRSELQHKETELRGALQQLASEQAKGDAREEKLKEQTASLEQLNTRMTNEFKLIANELLEAKGKQLNERQKESLETVLNPLKERIKEFEEQVRKSYDEEGKQRFALKSEIGRLVEQNQRLSQDADNLTRALLGESKIQGDWGEMILERVLEASGLKRDVHFTLQEGRVNIEGTKMIPDAVVKLPRDKNIIVDSKVSLSHYERYTKASSEAEREGLLKAHIDSMRAHAKGLASKNYSQLYGVRTVDFVLMFIPIEPAFLLALRERYALFQEAYDAGVVMVGTTNLMITLRTIDYMWSNERIAQNHQRIADRAGLLYDKFKLFTDDLLSVGTKLNGAQNDYKEAMKKLSTGPGNLVRQVEMIKEDGAKTNKTIDPKLLERSLEEETSTGA